MNHFLSRSNPFYKIYISFIFFGITLLGGIFGFMLFFDYHFIEACYMTLITLAAVGYGFLGNKEPIDMNQKIFIIFLILTNLAIFTYFITVVSRFFLDGEFIRVYKTIKMKKSINELKGHTIISGFGRNGQEASKAFLKNNMDYVVIERHARAANDVGHSMDYFLEGDATRDEVLIAAGIRNAKALITTLPEDADNLFVVLTARELNPDLKIISRASNDTSVNKLKRAGADNVIMPDKIGGSHMAALVFSPDVKEFIDVLSTTMSNDFQLSEMSVGKSFTIWELDSRNKTGATILGVKTLDGEYKLNPSSHYEVKIKERIIAMGSRSQLDHLISMIG